MFANGVHDGPVAVGWVLWTHARQLAAEAAWVQSTHPTRAATEPGGGRVGAEHPPYTRGN